MRRFLLVAIGVLAITSFVYAQTGGAMAKTLTLTGTIVDNACASGHMQDLANFVKAHTKECTLMPGCVASGYGIYADGKFSRFDKDSNAKVEAYLRKADSKLDVVVEAQQEGSELKLISIRGQ